MTEAPQAEAMSTRGAGESRSPVSYKWLIAILLMAFVLRLGFMLQFTPVISGDGCEYIRMGIELRDGKPLTGSFDWPETMYGTLYPVLIAGVSKLGLSAEHAAYALSLLFGMALVLIAFSLSRYLYEDDRVAYRAALLFALFPLFVGLSGSVFNESIYLTLWLSGIYWAIRALASFRLRDFLLAGLFFGLSTLSRPEAFAYPLFVAFATVLVGIFRKIRWVRTIAGVATLLGFWFVLMVPYAVFQHAHTGQYRFEGKWNINYTLGQRVDSGMTYYQAGFGIDADLHPAGPLLDSSQYATYTPYSHSLRDKLHYFARRIHRNWPNAYEMVTAVDFGGPAMFLLVVFGLFGKEWSAQRLRSEFVLIVMAVSIVVLMATAANLEYRYVYPLPVILLLWAAAGLDPFAGWVRRTIQSWGEKFQSVAGFAAAASMAGLCALLLLFAAVGFRTDPGFHIQRGGFLGIKQAGLWLGARAPKPARIAGFEGRVAYYADTTLIIFPYADSTTTLRYLETKRVEYIVLDSRHTAMMPTLGQWYEKGIPDSRAQLVYESTQGTEDRIRIFSWNDPRAVGYLASSSAVKE
jgi:4-amino-4-deoxy-L-arabinose transferase-like glycosyltransferase